VVVKVVVRVVVVRVVVATVAVDMAVERVAVMVAAERVAVERVAVEKAAAVRAVATQDWGTRVVEKGAAAMVAAEKVAVVTAAGVTAKEAERVVAAAVTAAMGATAEILVAVVTAEVVDEAAKALQTCSKPHYIRSTVEGACSSRRWCGHRRASSCKLGPAGWPHRDCHPQTANRPSPPLVGHLVRGGAYSATQCGRSRNGGTPAQMLAIVCLAVLEHSSRAHSAGR